MSPLVFALGCFAVAAWGSTALLVRAALRKPRIGALTERAILAFIISAYGTLGVLLLWNRESGFTLLPINVARDLFTASLFAVFFMPVVWLILFAANRLGGDR